MPGAFPVSVPTLSFPLPVPISVRMPSSITISVSNLSLRIHRSCSAFAVFFPLGMSHLPLLSFPIPLCVSQLPFLCLSLCVSYFPLSVFRSSFSFGVPCLLLRMTTFCVSSIGFFSCVTFFRRIVVRCLLSFSFSSSFSVSFTFFSASSSCHAFPIASLFLVIPFVGQAAMLVVPRARSIVLSVFAMVVPVIKNNYRLQTNRGLASGAKNKYGLNSVFCPLAKVTRVCVYVLNISTKGTKFLEAKIAFVPVTVLSFSAVRRLVMVDPFARTGSFPSWSIPFLFDPSQGVLLKKCKVRKMFLYSTHRLFGSRTIETSTYCNKKLPVRMNLNSTQRPTRPLMMFQHFHVSTQ